MPGWTGFVLVRDETDEGGMRSRLPACLHPIAGRRLVWHTTSLLAGLDPAPERIVVVATGGTLGGDHFEGVPVPVEIMTPAELAGSLAAPGAVEVQALVIDAAASASALGVQRLVGGASGGWLPGGNGEAVAAWVAGAALPPLLGDGSALRVPGGPTAAGAALPRDPDALVVRDRAQLARVSRRVHDRLVHLLMQEGVTFLLPETVLVDVDVRIGRDSVVYPGVVLEGQTTVGEETVIGPGCRIIDSWIGSGVELKGWNYISHASVRNRAILEPYVRRGFD